MEIDWNKAQGIGSLLQALGTIAAAYGLFLAKRQLRLAKEQEITRFEDEMTRQYREIVHRIPVEALLGARLEEKKLTENLDDFVQYFDLSNEQVFLRQQGRVRPETWVVWRDGIHANLRKEAFKSAWEIVKDRATEEFRELRWLETSGFEGDPRGENIP